MLPKNEGYIQALMKKKCKNPFRKGLKAHKEYKEGYDEYEGEKSKLIKRTYECQECEKLNNFRQRIFSPGKKECLYCKKSSLQEILPQ